MRQWHKGPGTPGTPGTMVGFSLIVVLLLAALTPHDAWASHCTLSGATVDLLTELTSRPNNDLSCNTQNSRSDGTTPFPGFSIFQMFKGASGSFGNIQAGGAGTGLPGGGGNSEVVSVTLKSFIDLNPGDITGNQFGRIFLLSVAFNKAANIGPFATDASLQSIVIPCGTGSGDPSPVVGQSGECPNSSNVANTSGFFAVNPAMTIESLSAAGNPVGIESFRQQFSGEFRFANNLASLSDFGGGAAITCAASVGALVSTCGRLSLTQNTGNATFDPISDPVGANGVRGSLVTIETAFAVNTLASGLQTSNANNPNRVDFRVAFHQLISQGGFQMNTLGSFRANSPAFMPAATYPNSLSLSSSLNFLVSQTASGTFLTRTVGAAGIESQYTQALTLSNCLPGLLTSTEAPAGARSTAFNGAFLFRGAFNDFSCSAPP